MLLPHAMQPKPPAPPPVVKPVVKKRASRAKGSTKSSAATKKKAATHKSARLPKSDADKPPALEGNKDLAYEIPEANLRHHVQGSESTWLPLSVMPRELRDGGFVYLQTDSTLVARCRVKGVGFRDRRWTHEAPGVTTEMGHGATLELHEDDWEFVSIDLGSEGMSEVRGYRYLITSADGSVRPALEDSVDES